MATTPTTEHHPEGVKSEDDLFDKLFCENSVESDKLEALHAKLLATQTELIAAQLEVEKLRQANSELQARRVIADDIQTLRITSNPIFAHQGLSHIIWAGVFGSFARDSHTNRSDVDVIVIHDPDKKIDRQCHIYIHDELPMVWGRKVSIVTIEDNELRGYVSVEALLCARTIYGSDQDDGVLQLKRNAREILENGFTKFTQSVDMIKKTKDEVSDLSEEEFLASPSLQQSVRDNLLHILEAIDVQPQWHPMHEGFWTWVVEDAEKLLRKIKIPDHNKDGTTSRFTRKYWEMIREAATTVKPGGMHDLSRSIRSWCLPTLKGALEQSELVQRLACKEQSEAMTNVSLEDKKSDMKSGVVDGMEPAVENVQELL